jgi:membrane protease YdiL (CAAX protease family)
LILCGVAIFALIGTLPAAGVARGRLVLGGWLRIPNAAAEWIRARSFRAEFAIVILAAFGPGILGSLRFLVAPDKWLHDAPLFTNTRLLDTLIFEVVVGSLLWRFLKLRGWTAARVGLSAVRPWSWKFLKTPLAALALALAASATGAMLIWLSLKLWPSLVLRAAARQMDAPDLRIAVIVAASLINPIFEEVFVRGYVISSLRERIGVANAVGVSTGIFIAYHLYKGVGVLAVVPGALLFALWFAYTKRLAPLIIAHAGIDFVPLTWWWWESSRWH